MTAKGVGSNINNPDHIFPFRCCLILHTQNIHKFFFKCEESIIEIIQEDDTINPKISGTETP
jgi:hypothetical protein